MKNLLVVLLGMMLFANFGFSAVIYVNATDGTACGVTGPYYAIIQDAIDASSDGDTIMICHEDMAYNQDFDIDKPLNVFGSEAGVEIRAPATPATVRITGSNVNITNLTVGNTEADAMLILSNYTNIYGNTISNTESGIEICDSAGAVLESNNITGNTFTNISGVAVFLNASSGNTINKTLVSGNTFSGNGADDGKAFYALISSGKVDFLRFLNNNITGYATGVEDDGSMNSVYANSTITNCGSSFIADGVDGAFISGNSINGSTNTVFSLTGCSRNTVRDNRAFNNTGTGFFLYSGSDYNILINNTALNNDPYGFHVLGGSNNNTLANNTAAYNGNTGIILESSYNNTVLNNTAYNSTGYAAIYVAGGGGNTLGRNVGYNSPYGLSLVNTINNTLANNSLRSNSLDGVLLDNATYTNLTGNNASRNNYDGFALYAYSNFNIFNSNTAEHNGHEDATYAFNGFLLDHSSGNEFSGDVAYNNSDLGFYLNTSENNTFDGSVATFNDIGAFYTFESDYNTFTGITANGNIAYGFFLQSSSGNNLSSVTAYDNLGYGIILLNQSDGNIISDSNIYSSLVYGIELYNSSGNLINNTNVSLIYFAGIILTDNSEGNELTGLNVSGNDAIGIGLSVEEQNSITDSVVAENGIFDVLPLACFSGAIDGVTGSGGRPINYSNSSVDWENFEASELILCNAAYSNVTNVTVRGSDSFNNNALIMWDSDNVGITGSNSSGNYMGFYIYTSQNAALANNTAMNTSFGGIVLESSNNATVRGSTIGNNFADDSIVFGLGTPRLGIYFWNSQDAALYDNIITDIWNSSAFLLEEQSSTEGFYNNTIFNATKGIEIINATIILTGDNYIYDTPAEGSEIYVFGDGYLYAMDGNMLHADFLNYSIYAENLKAKSVNLSGTEAAINESTYSISLGMPGEVSARVVKTPQAFGALNVTALSGAAYMDLVLPYNDSDAPSADFQLRNLGVGAYSGGSWEYLGRSSINTADRLVMVEGVSSFSYFAPVTYSQATSSSSGGRKDMDMNYTFNCSSGRLEVQAAYAGDAVSGLGITLFRDGRVQSSGITDYRGKVTFTLVQDGAYKAVSETTSNYFSGELALGGLQLCLPEGAAEGEAGTQEDAAAAPGANQTGAEEPQAGEPAPQGPEGPTREDALAAIASAQSAISTASGAGKDVADAQAKLQQANDALALGEYANAIEFARQAELLAGNAQAREISQPATPSTRAAPAVARGSDWAFIIGILLVLLAIAAGAYRLLARRK